jgi:CRP-like cAMP-binding protein
MEAYQMDTDEVIGVLRKCGVFAGLSDVELNAIAKLGKIEKFKAGDTIYPQGSMGTKLFILSEGQVLLERTIDIGGKRKANVPVFIQRESPCRRLMVNWPALVGEEHVQMCTAKCQKPTTVVSIISSELKDVISKNLEMKVKILEKLVLLLRDRIATSYEAMEAM